MLGATRPPSSRNLFTSRSFRLHRFLQYLAGRACSRIVNWRDRWLDPAALSFFQTMRDGGFDPEAHIDVLFPG